MLFRLSGNLAFGAHKISEIFHNTLNGSYQINDKRWKLISSEAKDLIKKLLDIEPEDRITLDEALTHPWFSKFDHNVS